MSPAQDRKYDHKTFEPSEKESERELGRWRSALLLLSRGLMTYKSGFFQGTVAFPAVRVSAEIAAPHQWAGSASTSLQVAESITIDYLPGILGSVVYLEW